MTYDKQITGYETQILKYENQIKNNLSPENQKTTDNSHLHISVPSPEVTAPFCLVPSPEFSQAPWYSLPDHLCRFGVRFDVT